MPDQHVATPSRMSGAEAEPARAWALTLIMVALLSGIAVALGCLVVPGLPRAAAPFGLHWLVLLPAFAATEMITIHLRAGRSTLTLSLGQVPTVVALAFVDPATMPLASVLGAGLVLVLRRRQRGIKLAFNIALWSCNATLAVSIYGLMLAGGPVDGLWSMICMLVTVVAVELFSAAAVTAVIAFHDGEVDRDAVRESLTVGMVVAISEAGTGILVVVLLANQPFAAPLLAMAFGVLVIVNRSYQRLTEAHRQLRRHHGFSRALAEVHGTGFAVTQILGHCRRMLDAEVAELHLAGSVYRSPEARSLRASALTEHWVALTAGGRAVRVRRDDADPETVAVLDAEGADEAMAVRLSLPGMVGVLVVFDCASEVACFTEEDVRALEAAAHQAVVALENGLLVDRLSAEAARRAHEALHDPLTGLGNRRNFTEALGAAIDQGRSVSVLMLDLDSFAEINEALGHSAGDDVLGAVAGRLATAVPEALLVARIGGDEFAVLLQEEPVHSRSAANRPTCAEAAALRVRQALASPIASGGLEIHALPSMGSARSDGSGEDAHALLQRADLAMHRAKEQRSGYEPWVAALDRSGPERLARATALRHAVRDAEIDVYFQPLVCPTSGRVLGAEALARWSTADGPISPAEFIPLAEHCGLIGPLTEHVFGLALDHCARWRSAGLLPSVSVNLSARLLHHESLVATIEGLLSRSGLPSSAVVLEITEGAIMNDREAAVAVLEALDEIGFQLAIDDFGTGYSSLAYLKHLPVDELKVDQSFVRDLATSATDAAIVRSTIALAHELGLHVVAEGVEDEVTLQRLAEMGCDAVQGYHLSRPLPAVAFERWLAGRAALPLHV